MPCTEASSLSRRILRQQRTLARLTRKIALERMHADLDRHLALAADVDLARRIVADEDHGKAGDEAVARRDLPHLARHAGAQACGEGLAVDDARTRRRLNHEAP